MLMLEIAVSTLSTPASAAFTIAAVDMPVVAWHCIWMGIFSVCFRRLTSSKAT